MSHGKRAIGARVIEVLLYVDMVDLFVCLFFCVFFSLCVCVGVCVSLRNWACIVFTLSIRTLQLLTIFALKFEQVITKTRLYSFDPLKPHFYTV